MVATARTKKRGQQQLVMHSLFNPFAQPLWITGLTTPFGVDSRLRRVPSYPHVTPRARFAGLPTKSSLT